MKVLLRSIWVLAALGASVRAEVRLPALVSDHMVLQRNKRVPIWGWADPGEKVSVRIAGQTAHGVTDEKGRWVVRIGPLDTRAAPLEMTVTGRNTITVKDILVGDVWICAGQSNMEMRLGSNADAKRECAAADYPRIRLCRLPHAWTADGPKQDAPGARWQACSPASARHFSAVGYFFGRHLHQALKIPIGLIDNSKGGSPAESWTNPADMKDQPAYKGVFARWRRLLAEYDKATDEQKATHRFKRFSPASHLRPGVLWNGMVAPLMPYAIKGTIWYQGEANLGRAYEYRTIFPAMVRSWRKAWGQGDFAFLFVQLPNFGKRTGDPNERSSWPEMREAQTMALDLPHTAMAVRIDGPVDIDYHPKDKRPFGHRLALAALGPVYGQPIVYSGPTFESMTVEDSAVRVRFKHAGVGLVAKGGPLKGFAIAGADKDFHWADARIDGHTVVLTSDAVPKPVAVRYAYAANPACNLYNKEGLPGAPFRTDQWTHWTRRTRR